MTDPAVVLTIGGSDSAGCYGVQADLRTFAALGAHGCCALTVVTAQNTDGVRQALPLPVELIAAQLDAVLADLPVAAVKTGMLGRVDVVELIAARAAEGRLPHLVVDPVLVNRYGEVMFTPALGEAYRQRLLPYAAVVTPNSLEATLLAGPSTGPPPGNAAVDTTTMPLDVEVLAATLGAPTVVTGGRRGGATALDVLWDGAALHLLDGPRATTANNAGSGDTFSAAVAVELAEGATLLDAVRAAKAFVTAALLGATDWQLGSGPGPLDPFGWTAAS